MPSLRPLATGAALPRTVWPNDALIAARGLDSSDSWIRERTGIAQRYLAEPDETTSTLATAAAAQALARAGVTPAEVGLLLVATCTPDLTVPSTAALVHGALGLATTCPAMDINAACSGFVYALQVAQGLAAVAPTRYALVIGAETFSRIVDWQDRATCVLFGDGAGALLLENVASPTPTGLLGVSLGAEGAAAPMLCTTGGLAHPPAPGHVFMQGREVYKHAVRQMGHPPALLAAHGYKVDDIDWLVPHQANARILSAAAAALGVDDAKVVSTVAAHANTSAASIPLALDVAVTDGRIQPGNVVLLQAFGAGFTWGDALFKW